MRFTWLLLGSLAAALRQVLRKAPVVLVRGAVMNRRRCSALLACILVAFGLTACDPTWAFVVDNQAAVPILIGRVGASAGEADLMDVVIGSAGSRTMVGQNGVGRTYVLWRIVIMTESCEILADETFTKDKAFLEGGLIVVDPDLTISVTAGGNPPAGIDPISTDDCLSTIDANRLNH